ncbi:hypothetical protein KC328_g2526 [Hortaea werneckii]|nr:hypothetical protein KC328_g2526 [Hortaea werneckii]
MFRGSGMETFMDFTRPAGFHDAGENDQAHYYSAAAAPMGDPTKTSYIQQQVPCDIKPRLTKEQHDVLEAEFQRQHKPNTITKKRFAEVLGVSLDKVNNWFQNRRAKSKHDARKQQEQFQVFPQHQSNSQAAYSSDSEISPAYPAQDYCNMMQQFGANDMSGRLDIPRSQQFPQPALDTFANLGGNGSTDHFHNMGIQAHQESNMFDSPQELNRRTLTQEQFDAFAQGGLQGSDQYSFLQPNVSGGHDFLNDCFPELQGADGKLQQGYMFSGDIPAPMSSHDSSIPSSLSDHSISGFPINASMQAGSVGSANSSDWDGSRSSSIHQEEPLLNMQPHQTSQPARSASQWQPGQSVPIDPYALSQEFKKVSKSRSFTQQPSQLHEQPLAWPDEAFGHRDSSASLLAHSMSNVGLHTPQPVQNSTFRSPAPPTNIAARRQRPRPAGLHLGGMRTQSYNSAVQPGSPGQLQPQNTAPVQSLRRIRSSNVINNGVTQGRVQKGAGASQRSPLAWTFSDAIHSPKAVRHASAQAGSGSLAPPTPMSPREFPRTQAPTWQASGRQPSINETDLEHSVNFAPLAPVPTQNSTSPPTTPMYHQQNLVQQRVGNNVITENTPPQSAPASQQSFSTNGFGPPPPQQIHTQPSSQVQAAPPQPSFATPPQHQFMSVLFPEQNYQVPSGSLVPHASFGPPAHNTNPGLAAQYPHGVPIVNDSGEIQMMMTHQLPFTQQQTPLQPQQMTAPAGQYGMFATSVPQPPMQVTAAVPKQPTQPASDFFVHEYSPPQDLKRTATPRKSAAENSGPKNYTFANQTPEHFEKGMKKAEHKSNSTTSSSPASSNGAGHPS